MTTQRPRYLLVDVLRGLAIVLMIVYHFTFDLNYFHRVRVDFYHDPFWLNFRALIVSLFLGLVGVSLFLATRHGLDRARFLRRLGRVAGCAVLVSLGSYLVFPRSMIFFGILHFIAVASVLALPLVRFHWLNLVLGLALLALGLGVQHPLFDHPALQWVGLMTHKPVTEDYVPLFPWLGVVLLGIFAGRLLYREPLSALARWHSDHPLPRLLALGGRHSLLIYMVHQPLFFTVLGAIFTV
ncbi:MAG TPA: DUF1624 domain-containing protein [Gammaproteobacteria bacterium]|nr:DUF1624 domain-containing protein [Gammaproteobacteria bacterium]